MFELRRLRQEFLLAFWRLCANESKEYDGFMFGIPTRFGVMSAQMMLGVKGLAATWH